MGKYYGHIGYGVSTETAPGVWSVVPIEKEVYGMIEEDLADITVGENLNDNVSMNMRISFIADAFAINNYLQIKYATHMNVKWKVKSTLVDYPRILLSLGGVYNG